MKKDTQNRSEAQTSRYIKMVKNTISKEYHINAATAKFTLAEDNNLDVNIGKIIFLVIILLIALYAGSVFMKRVLQIKSCTQRSICCGCPPLTEDF